MGVQDIVFLPAARTPAKAGTQLRNVRKETQSLPNWGPAFAGVRPREAFNT